MRRFLKPKGQVTTFMLLMIGGVLIFVMATANMGQMSLNSTRIANAADSSALMLGSQLATKARVLGESLGKPGAPKDKRCMKTGSLSLVIAIVVAVVVAVAAWYAAPAIIAAAAPIIGTIAAGTATTVATVAITTAAGAVGGAAGGALGGSIAGTGAATGALQGAQVGAAIGAAVGGGMAAGGEMAGFGGAEVEVGAEGAGLGSGTAPISTGGTLGGAPLVAGSTMAVPAAVAGAGLAVASNLYTASVQDQVRAAAFAKVSKLLSGLPEFEQFREGTMFSAFIQTVDDPTFVPDTTDFDEDGKTDDQISAFLHAWEQRLIGIIATLGPLTQDVQAFFNGPLTAFNNVAKATFTSTTTTVSTVDQITGLETQTQVVIGGSLSRQEIEGVDGLVVGFLRSLEQQGHDVSFWIPGPSSSELGAWEQADCDDCSAPASYDAVDNTIDVMKDFVDTVSGTDDGEQDDEDGLIEQPLVNVVSNWENWITLFHDPDPQNSGDFFDTLGVVVDGNAQMPGIRAWQAEVERIRQSLPQCIPHVETIFDQDGFGSSTRVTGVENAPCRGDGTSVPATGGSVDDDLDDEFTQVQQSLESLATDIETFRTALEAFRAKMIADSTLPDALVGTSAITGGNPATYTWQDTRGPHSIQVLVGPFKIPSIRKKKYGSWLKGKLCLELRDHTDTGARTFVRITRADPPQPMALWTWNPNGTIRKTSRIAFSMNDVHVAGVQ